MGHILSLNPNFCVTTDRYAVFIISVSLTMILYDVPSDIARNILDITFHT